MNNIFGEKIEEKKCKSCLAHYTGKHTCPPFLKALVTAKKKEKPQKVYSLRDTYEGFIYFVVARTPGGVRAFYTDECGITFEETFSSDIEISRVPKLDKYIGIEKGREDWSYYQINPFEDEEWMRALYAEGGHFEYRYCDKIGDEYDDKVLAIEELIDRECRHADGSKCETWDDESVCIVLP